MTTDSVPAGGDPRRLLSEVRTLADQVRLDQRLTWAALLVLATVTFAAIPFDWYFLVTDCRPTADGSVCDIWRRGAQFYWPPALLLAYAVIAVAYVRTARARGLGARVLPFAITGAALTALSAAAWLVAHTYLRDNPPAEPFPGWVMMLDRLIAPAGMIGIALLVLARIERNLALLAFTLGYLAMVLVVPIDFAWGFGTGERTGFLPQQFVNGMVLLLGAAGFALAGRMRR